VSGPGRLLDNDLQNDPPMPYCTLSDHTLPVTDIKCGIGPFPTCRALTSSADHSVKVRFFSAPIATGPIFIVLQLWDLSSKSLLTTFQFPQSIACLAWDLTERMFFAASSDGSVHQMNLFRHRDDKFGMQTVEAVGGAGVSGIVRVGDDSQTNKKRLISIGYFLLTVPVFPCSTAS
jgi:pre-rRNA-processing protein IPI3